MKWKIVIAVGFVLGLIAIAVFVDSLPYQQAKQSSFNSSELIPTRVEIPVQSNGYSVLIQAGTLLATSGYEPILGETNWNEAEARNLLEKNKDAIAIFRKAMSFPYLQMGAITNVAGNADHFSEWKKLAQLANLDACSSFNTGDEANAFAHAVEVIRFGQRIQEADGELIDCFIGAAIKNIGLSTLRHFAGRTKLPASDLVAVSEQLTNFEADVDGLCESLKIEYSIQARLFDEMAVAPNQPFYFKLTYNADKSKRDLSGQIYCTMRALTNCYAIGITNILSANTNISYVARLLTGNAMGTILNDMMLETRGGILASKCRENVNVRATRIILALHAYEMTNHKPASSLTDLVPDFLDAAPLDDFDGKPMRYAPSLKEVYSVGQDLIDSGGIKGTNSHTGDIVFPYNF